MNESIAEWFGLKSEHQNFFIESDANAAMLFSRSELDTTIRRLLRRSFRNRLPPKFVLWGDWGVGKTHVMKHIMYWMETQPEFSANCAFVEIPDLSAKSTFAVLHAALMDAVGMDRVKTWMFQYNAKFQTATMKNLKEVAGQSEDIARAFNTLLTFGDSARVGWDWLRATALSAVDARGVGLPPALEQSQHLVAVLRVLGVLSKEVEDKMLVLMVDEAARLEVVSKPEAIGHWMNAFRLLSDPGSRELGFVVSGSFTDFDRIVPMLNEEMVIRRFGRENYLQLSRFEASAAKEFASALLYAWIDAEKRSYISSTFVGETAGESVADTSFPFTERGLELFVEYSCRDGGVVTPAKVQQDLDNFVNRAMDDALHILSSKYVEALIFGGGP